VGRRQNVYTYLLAIIQNQGIQTAYAELTKLWAVKDKIATFVIRDIGLMNLGLIESNFESAFPVDRWVKRLAKMIGCAPTSEKRVKRFFIDKCREASLAPLGGLGESAAPGIRGDSEHDDRSRVAD